MKRPQAKFHLLSDLLAQMGIHFIAPREDIPLRKHGIPGRKVFRTLGGWRRRKARNATDKDLIQAAADRRVTRAAKRHANYLKCPANNPCLGGGL